MRALIVIVACLAAFVAQAGTERIGDVTIQFPNSYKKKKSGNQVVANTPNASIAMFGLADPIAAEWVAMADIPGPERDGLFDALTNRGVLRMVEFVLSAGGSVIEIDNGALSV